MSNPYRQPQSSAKVEILAPEDMPIRAVNDPLPVNPLATSLQGGSLRGMVNRAATRAALNREALELYKTAAVETMRAQVDVLIQGRSLEASTAKRLQFEAFLARNTEIVNRLWERLGAMVDSMSDGALETMIRAEEEAQARKAEIEAKVAGGRLDRAAADRLHAVIDEHRHNKCRGSDARSQDFLAELNKQLTMTIRQMEIDGKRWL